MSQLLRWRRTARLAAGAETFKGRALWHGGGVDLTYQLDGGPSGRGLEAAIVKLRAAFDPATRGTANLVGSLTSRGTHLPVLDCDFPVETFPSTRPGHTHVYFERETSRWRMIVMLVGLATAGMVEWTYVLTAALRGVACVRPPWRQKRMGEGARAEWTAAAKWR